jgi:glycosyltransferase involved in cell wall biosynthesis
MTIKNQKVDFPISILMPVFNEVDIIEEVIEEWVKDVFHFLPDGSEILIDEAASTDGTREILTRMCEKYPFIRVTYNETRDGFAAAARRLYSSAKCPWLVFTDSDGQYIASEFWKLAKYITRYDIIHGAKLARQDPFFRRLFSLLFNKWAVFLFQERYLDINSAFRLMKTEVVKELLPQLRIMPSLLNTELLLRCEFANYEIKQVYIMHRSRKHGSSRGLPTIRYFFEGFKAFLGLLQIKESYRK